MLKNYKIEIAEALDKIEGGEADALQHFTAWKEQADFIQEALKQIKDLALQEFERYGEKSITLNGFEITKRNGFSTYDLSANPDYKNAKAEADRIGKILKQASKMGKAIVDEESGECWQPCPIKSGSSDSLVIKPVKQ